MQKRAELLKEAGCAKKGASTAKKVTKYVIEDSNLPEFWTCVNPDVIEKELVEHLDDKGLEVI